MQNITIIQAWRDFFKNIFNFNGKTTRKGYWSIVLVQFLVMFLLSIILFIYIYNFMMELYTTFGIQALNRIILLLEKNPFYLFNLDTNEYALSVSMLNQLSFIKILIMIFGIIMLVFKVSILMLSIRRYRDVGINEKILKVLLAIKIIMLFIGFPSVIQLIVVLLLDLVLPCLKSNRLDKLMGE